MNGILYEKVSGALAQALELFSFPPYSEAGWLDLCGRRENFEPESSTFFLMSGIQNNSTSGTSIWSLCVKVQDARHCHCCSKTFVWCPSLFTLHLAVSSQVDRVEGSTSQGLLDSAKSALFCFFRWSRLYWTWGSCHLFAIYLLINLKCLTWRRHHKWQVVQLGAAANSGIHSLKGVIQVKSVWMRTAVWQCPV